jgi:hypothetical protein
MLYRSASITTRNLQAREALLFLGVGEANEI